MVSIFSMVMITVTVGEPIEPAALSAGTPAPGGTSAVSPRQRYAGDAPAAPGGTSAVSPRLRYAGDAPAAPDTWALALRLRDATRRQILRHCGEPDLEHERSPIEEASDT